jgi:uncharacterized membrane protein
MGEILDTIVLVAFVLFLVFLMNGFIKQSQQRHDERIKKGK